MIVFNTFLQISLLYWSFSESSWPLELFSIYQNQVRIGLNTNKELKRNTGTWALVIDILTSLIFLAYLGGTSLCLIAMCSWNMIIAWTSPHLCFNFTIHLSWDESERIDLIVLWHILMFCNHWTRLWFICSPEAPRSWYKSSKLSTASKCNTWIGI